MWRQQMKAFLSDVYDFQQYLKNTRLLSDSSISVYTFAIENFLKNDPDIDDIDQYNRFLIETAVKKRSNYNYSVLKAYIQFKIKDGNLKNRMVETLLKPPLKYDIVRERKYLPEDELIQLLNHLKREKHRVIGIIQLLTGVRVGDILRCKYGNIQPEIHNNKEMLKIILTGKGGKRNVVYVSDDTAMKLILNYITDNEDAILEGYHFIELSPAKHRRSNAENEYKVYRMNYFWFWEDLKMALEACGISKEDFATHDFRRCIARRCWEKYKDIQKLKNLLNHQNVQTSMRYLEQSGMKNIDLHIDMQS